MSNNNYHILIIDDESQFHQQIRYDFRKNYTFEGALDIPHLEKKLDSKETYDLILLDLVLDNNSKEKIGLTLLPKIIAKFPSTPIIVVTNDDEIDTVVEAMNGGAKSFLQKKKYDFEKWNRVFRETIESVLLKQENKQLKQELTQVKEQYEYKNPNEYPLLGKSLIMERLRRTLKIVADDSDLTVMITGETGVGKGVAARFLHYNSLTRRDKPFEDIHITNITRDLLESTLFGAKKGSFTGAINDIKGRLHMADKGTVFLDEIGELSLEIQVKLLQFLQTKVIRPIGTDKDIQLDVQIITATNKNLLQEVEKGNFREDLYQRLKVFPVEIPPLRERREDIPELLMHFMKLSSVEELNEKFEPSTLQFLEQEYDWLGNIRELENSIKTISVKQVVHNTPIITMECLPDDMLKRQTHSFSPGTNNTTLGEASEKQELASFFSEDLETQNAWNTLRAIEDALIKKNGVKQDVAKLLNYNSSDHIRYRVLSIQKKYPHFMKHFPIICKKYKIKIIV